jgi:DNA invertase Pin-like site-specific DNA recombinase
MAVAYSYLRFSSPQQAAGDSIRRQVQAAAGWCEEHKVPLDATLSMRDAGVSAFRGGHRDDKFALGQFLAAIKSGRVVAGSYLLVENLDRLTREDAGEATELFLSIVNRGVVVVQLSPVVMEYRRPVNVQSLMFAIVELSRGHSESAMKSERIGAAWAQKRKGAAEAILTARLPGWVQFEGEAVRLGNKVVYNGELVLNTGKAQTVRTIFRLAAEGLGVSRIAERLNEDGVPVLGRTEFNGKPVRWAGPTVYFILTNRATIGEFQPHRGRGKDRRPDGEPVKNYFPAVVSEQEFYAVQAQLETRATVNCGRRGNHVNIFSGLLVDARDGGTLTYKHDPKLPTVLIPINAKHGRGSPWVSFRADVFEAAVLSQLREIKARDVFPDHTGGSKVETASAKLAETDSLIRGWRAKMDRVDLIDTITDKLNELEGRRKAQAAELAAAQQEAASPLAESWGEFRSLAGMLAADPKDELRERVRNALRRAIESIYCLFIASPGRPRLAAVQVWFRQPGQHRDYLVVHDVPAGYRRPGRWSARSFAAPGAEGLDLRRRDHAKRLEKVLGMLDLKDEV